MSSDLDGKFVTTTRHVISPHAQICLGSGGMSVISKADLRTGVALISILSLVGIIVYIIVRSEIRIVISDSVNVNNIVSVFLTLISVVVGWLFGRRERD